MKKVTRRKRTRNWTTPPESGTLPECNYAMAALASRHVDGITVLGGLVLNATASGGRPVNITLSRKASQLPDGNTGSQLSAARAANGAGQPLTGTAAGP